MSKETQPTQGGTRQDRQPPRTGPLGRIARLLLAAAAGAYGYAIYSDRAEVFAASDPLTDPILWIIAALMVHGVYRGATLMAGWTRSAALVLTAGVVILAVVLGAVAWVLEGTIWTAPLTWLVWGLVVGVMALIALTALAAVVTGTPGCEGGVLRTLIRRWRGEPDDDKPIFCPPLTPIDAFERRMPWHRDRRPRNEGLVTVHTSDETTWRREEIYGDEGR